MRGNSQNGGQTTKSLLIKPQCSGVPIQQAVSLSSSFPRHCLLFVCAFFREMQAGPRPECSLPPTPPHTKTAPDSCCGNRGGSFALFVLSQALTQLLAGVLDSSLGGDQNYRAFLASFVLCDYPQSHSLFSNPPWIRGPTKNVTKALGSCS